MGPMGRLPRPLDGQTVGIAILNHPEQLPLPDRLARPDLRPVRRQSVRPQGFDEKSKEDGTYTLPKGQTLLLRYRVILHLGDEKEGKIAEAFAAYEKDVMTVVTPVR